MSKHEPTLDLHFAVKQLFQTMDIHTLFRVAKDNFEEKKETTRDRNGRLRGMGRHSVARYERARHARRKAGKTPYYSFGKLLIL